MSFTASATRDEMRRHVQDVASLSALDNRNAALRFAADLLKLPFSRVKCLFYGEARRIEAHEADQIRAYVEAAHKLMQAKAEYEALRREYIATAHPSLLRFAPAPLAGVEVQDDRTKKTVGE